MEGKLKCMPELGCSLDSEDAKYVSGLSTILVATIQDAKDRISQIEYIFCNQLYPNFQCRSKSLQKSYSEGKKDAEDAWKVKERDLLLQIDQLRLEKQEVVEENHRLELEKEKSVGEVYDERVNSLLDKINSHEIRIEELEQEVLQKSQEIDEGMKLQKKLLEIMQTNASTVLDREKRLKEHEDCKNELLIKMKRLEEKIEKLRGDNEQKTRSLEWEEAQGRKLLRHFNSLISRVADSATKAEKLEKENEELKFKLELMEEDVCKLREEDRNKTEEIERAKELREQLIKQIDGNRVEMLKEKQQLEESEKNRKLLADKVHDLEKKVNELQDNLDNLSKEAEGKHSHEKLLQEVELKSTELLAERKKKGDLVDAYKKLKSQYNYLCSKFGLTTDNMIRKNKFEDESAALKLQRSNTNSTAACEVNKIDKVSVDILEDKTVQPLPVSAINSATSNHTAPYCPPSIKSAPIIGTKRPASCWIGTRSRPRSEGHDPHDDFLDTPLENLRRNLNKTTKEEVHDLYIPQEKAINSDSSDDITQDANANPSPEKEQMPFPVAGEQGFKYVEPVRKKIERENLKGIECKQCKKFYDAVLPDNGGRDADGNKHDLRCEHHDGVSRHRYKYVPPMTPEGFWNIGFESEM